MAKVFIAFSVVLAVSLALGEENCAADVEEIGSAQGAALIQRKAVSENDVEKMPYVGILASQEDDAKQRVQQQHDKVHKISAEKIEKQMVADFKTIEVEVADKKAQAVQQAEQIIREKHAEAEKAEADTVKAAEETEKNLAAAKQAVADASKEREASEKEASEKEAAVSEAAEKLETKKAEATEISSQRKAVTEQFLEKESTEKVESIKLKQKAQVLKVTEEAAKAINDAEGIQGETNASGTQASLVAKPPGKNASKVSQTQQAALESAKAEAAEQKQGHKAAFEEKQKAAKALADAAAAQEQSENQVKEHAEAASVMKNESLAANEIVAGKKDAEKSASDAVDAHELELRRLKKQKEALSKVKESMEEKAAIAKESAAAAEEERAKVVASRDFAVSDLTNKSEEEQNATLQAVAEEEEAKKAEDEKSNAFGYNGFTSIRLTGILLLAVVMGQHAC